MPAEKFGAEVCSQPVPAASAGYSHYLALDGPRLPSLAFGSLGPQLNPGPSLSMQLTDRDVAIIELVARYRAVRADQVQLALFSPGAASRCQRRLTLLVRNHYLDRLPRRQVSDPAVYILSRRSTLGNRLVRARLGDELFRRHMTKFGSLPHQLAINDLRVRVERSCRELGWELRQWLTAEGLLGRLPDKGLVPDAYFHLLRADGSGLACFLELERASKSLAVVRSKLQRYASLYRHGRDETSQSSRLVLFVFDEVFGTGRDRRPAMAAVEAARLGVTNARFASLTAIKNADPMSCFTDALWLPAGEQPLVPLFPLGSGATT